MFDQMDGVGLLLDRNPKPAETEMEDRGPGNGRGRGGARVATEALSDS